jgi:alkylation response protein AidB-like acyl-CoA dehydrogenase
VTDTDTSTEMWPSSDPAALTAAVGEFLDSHFDESITVREWWRRLADAGLAYPAWPAGLGGFGASPAVARSVTAVLARRGVIGPPAGGLAAGLAAPTLLRHGTPAQAATYVRQIATGEAAWCQLFSEPGSGSDLASVGTRAVRDGDGWVVSGQKVWNSGADVADFGMLLARTDPDQPKHKGLTYFILDMHQAGVEVRPLRQMNGAASFCEVFLTEARIAAGHTVGAVNAGWTVALTTLAAERSSTAGASMRGLVPAQSGRAGDLDLTVGEVLDRARKAVGRRRAIRGGAVPAEAMLDLARQYGRASDLALRQELASYVSQVRINGWTLRRIGAAGGRMTGADGSIAKLLTSRICQQSREVSYRIVGAAGLLSGPDSPLGGELQTVNLGSPGTRIGGGTDEIQLNVIAERALGLPREPSADRDVPYRELRVGTQR